VPPAVLGRELQIAYSAEATQRTAGSSTDTMPSKSSGSGALIAAAMVASGS
jgi:hypothetical protein